MRQRHIQPFLRPRARGQGAQPGRGIAGQGAARADLDLAQRGQRKLGIGARRRRTGPQPRGFDKAFRHPKLAVAGFGHHMQRRRPVDAQRDIDKHPRLRLGQRQYRRNRHGIVVQHQRDLPDLQPLGRHDLCRDLGAGIIGAAIGRVDGDDGGAVAQRAVAVKLRGDAGPDRILGHRRTGGQQRHGKTEAFHGEPPDRMKRPKARGPSPTSISCTTSSVAASITLSVLSNQLATITKLPSALVSMPSG